MIERKGYKIETNIPVEYQRRVPLLVSARKKWFNYMKYIIILFSCCCYWLLSSCPASAAERVGWLEDARIIPGDLLVKSKIDTGAKTSSLNCSNCKLFFDLNGQRWVHFSVTDLNGKTMLFEKKVLRMAAIKRHFGEAQLRPVIQLGLCLGGVYKLTDVNLIDRSGFKYQLLIGREFLQQTHVVDPGKTFISTPACE